MPMWPGGDYLNTEAALDALYKMALETIDLWNDNNFVEDFRRILAIILVAHLPLSSSAIDALVTLPANRSSMHTTLHLACLLQQYPTVHICKGNLAVLRLITQASKGGSKENI
jgi:hypothetical protein